MPRTVADEVFGRVEELAAGPRALPRGQAIRRVAEEMGRTEGATRSAYYAARRARLSAVDDADESAARGHHHDSQSLFAEMLPLVEAGGSVEQAARRFGDEDSVSGIAAGFRRWLAREGIPLAEPLDDVARADGPGSALSAAEDKVAALEAENRALRHDLARARSAINRAGAILESAG